MRGEDAQQPVVGVKEQIPAKEAECSTPAAIFLFRLWSLGDIIRWRAKDLNCHRFNGVYRQEIKQTDAFKLLITTRIEPES